MIWQQGVAKVIDREEKVIEVPTEDPKTREMIRYMGSELQRVYSKYPKVRNEANPDFVELINSKLLTVLTTTG